jgi:hypothetical protein
MKDGAPQSKCAGTVLPLSMIFASKIGLSFRAITFLPAGNAHLVSNNFRLP